MAIEGTREVHTIKIPVPDNDGWWWFVKVNDVVRYTDQRRGYQETFYEYDNTSANISRSVSTVEIKSPEGGATLNVERIRELTVLDRVFQWQETIFSYSGPEEHFTTHDTTIYARNSAGDKDENMELVVTRIDEIRFIDPRNGYQEEFFTLNWTDVGDEDYDYSGHESAITVREPIRLDPYQMIKSISVNSSFMLVLYGGNSIAAISMSRIANPNVTYRKTLGISSWSSGWPWTQIKPSAEWLALSIPLIFNPDGTISNRAPTPEAYFAPAIYAVNKTLFQYALSSLSGYATSKVLAFVNQQIVNDFGEAFELSTLGVVKVRNKASGAGTSGAAIDSSGALWGGIVAATGSVTTLSTGSDKVTGCYLNGVSWNGLPGGSGIWTVKAVVSGPDSASTTYSNAGGSLLPDYKAIYSSPEDPWGTPVDPYPPGYVVYAGNTSKAGGATLSSKAMVISQGGGADIVTAADYTATINASTTEHIEKDNLNSYQNSNNSTHADLSVRGLSYSFDASNSAAADFGGEVSVSNTGGGTVGVTLFNFPYGIDTVNNGYANTEVEDGDGAQSFTAITPYESFIGKQIAGGWFHVSNGKHIMQGFMLNDPASEEDPTRHIYLDGADYTSTLVAAVGTGVETIDAIILDVKMAEIEALK